MIAALLLSLAAAASQPPRAALDGDVRDSVTQAPVAGALVTDIASLRRTITDARGHFSIETTLPARIRVERAGYSAREVLVSDSAALRIALAPSGRALETVTITALRGGPAYDAAPISQRTLSREELERGYFGQEVPLVLQGAPSVSSYAEAGTYWGYSYIRLRGLDQSRINLTIDGIPLNDPEDQVLYFADFPDLANSLESVQIQRGVGTSSAGTASYAGSINLETMTLATRGRGTEVQVGGGSFDTRRASLEYHSGLLSNRLAFYARASALQTDGYRYHSGVMGRSALFSGGYFGDRNIVKVMATAGLLHDTLSYLAVVDSQLTRDRRINPLRPTELDRFGEQLGSVAYTRLLGAASSIATTVYRISASGNYDVAIDPDLWNFNLDFVWYGLTSAWSWQRQDTRVSVGVNGNTYARDHSAYIRPNLANPLYLNTGHKRDASSFVKVAYDLAGGRASLFGDVQTRWAEFRYSPDINAGIAGGSTSWHFVNPKAGITYRLTPSLQAYSSYGRNSREPARNDMFAGFDNLDTTNAAFVGSFSRVRPETVGDLELGLSYRGTGLALHGNLFSMRFRHEIAPIGALSYLGLPLRKNVDRSWRRGIELDAEYRGIPRLQASVSATVMEARIADYADDATGEQHVDVEPLLTPKLLTGQRLQYAVARGVTVALDGRYTGRAQLDNTGDPRLRLPASYMLDGSATWSLDRYALELRANNLTDSKKFSSGYGGAGDAYYYVLPPRNLFATLKVNF
jgi:iron complex outermembrane receptor protein